ncbi:MAG: carboxypeptidase-like regulatory domain-containing protein [Chitinophagaceae bacterium]
MKTKQQKNKNWVLLLAFFAMLAFSPQGFAQNTARKITGKIVSQATGKAVPGATVSVQGTKNTIAADANGSWHI